MLFWFVNLNFCRRSFQFRGIPISFFFRLVIHSLAVEFIQRLVHLRLYTFEDLAERNECIYLQALRLLDIKCDYSLIPVNLHVKIKNCFHVFIVFYLYFEPIFIVLHNKIATFFLSERIFLNKSLDLTRLRLFWS